MSTGANVLLLALVLLLLSWLGFNLYMLFQSLLVIKYEEILKN